MISHAPIASQKQLDLGVHLLTLTAPEIARRARAGQFVMLHPDRSYDPLLARPFSLHWVDGDRISILYQVVGKGTDILARRRPGESLRLWGPLGRPFDLTGSGQILVAGGMGAAPLGWAARKIAAGGQTPPLLLGLASLGGSEGMVQYLRGLPLALEIATEDGSAGTRGKVTALLPPGAGPGEVLACGPLPMLAAVAAWTRDRRVSCQISLEAPMACGIGACLGCVLPAAGGGYLRACQEGPVLPADGLDWERL